MGREARLRKTATQKLIGEYPDCCFCAGSRLSTTREHMPPKSLFDGSYRPANHEMPSCAECNISTSTADLAAAIISRWGYAGQTEINHTDHDHLVSRMRKQAPEIVEEWTKNHTLRARITAKRHLRREGVQFPDDAGVVQIGPNTIRQLNLFSYKATLALYWEHFRRPLSEGGLCYASFRTKEDYAATGLPRDLLQMLPRYAALAQGKWDTREIFEYRHNLNQDEGVFAFFARLRRSLFISGFVIEDAGKALDDTTGWFATGSDLLKRVASLQRRD